MNFDEYFSRFQDRELKRIQQLLKDQPRHMKNLKKIIDERNSTPEPKVGQLITDKQKEYFPQKCIQVLEQELTNIRTSKFRELGRALEAEEHYNQALKEIEQYAKTTTWVPLERRYILDIISKVKEVNND